MESGGDLFTLSSSLQESLSSICKKWTDCEHATLATGLLNENVVVLLAHHKNVSAFQSLDYSVTLVYGSSLDEQQRRNRWWFIPSFVYCSELQLIICKAPLRETLLTCAPSWCYSVSCGAVVLVKDGIDYTARHLLISCWLYFASDFFKEVTNLEI